MSKKKKDINFEDKYSCLTMLLVLWYLIVNFNIYIDLS